MAFVLNVLSLQNLKNMISLALVSTNLKSKNILLYNELIQFNPAKIRSRRTVKNFVMSAINHKCRKYYFNKFGLKQNDIETSNDALSGHLTKYCRNSVGFFFNFKLDLRC